MDYLLSYAGKLTFIVLHVIIVLWLRQKMMLFGRDTCWRIYIWSIMTSDTYFLFYSRSTEKARTAVQISISGESGWIQLLNAQSFSSLHRLIIFKTKSWKKGLPRWSSGWGSVLPMQEAWVRSLIRELGPTCYILLKIRHATTKIEDPILDQTQPNK